MISKAQLNYLKIAPRKVRLVADLIREKEVEEAQNILNFTQKRAALPLLKLLNQALKNAQNQHSNVKDNNLFISKIIVNEGPVAKRRLPRARGRADVIRKRTSHVTIILDEIKKEVKDTTKRKKKLSEKEDTEKKKKTEKKNQKKKESKTKKEKVKERNKKKKKRRSREDYSKTKKGLKEKKRQEVFNRKAF